jgi:ketosteroid isomerase-like protein
MNTQQIANDLVALCKAGKLDEFGDKYWAEDVTSVEAAGPPGADLTARGKAAVKGKGAWWYDNHEVHSTGVEGPYVNGDQFAVRYSIDFTVKASGQRLQMTEVALYTVRDGKVVEERFFYGGQ